MKKHVQRSVSLAVATIIIISSLISGNVFSGINLTAKAANGSTLGVRYRSQSEIISYLNSHSFSNTERVTFSSNPSVNYPYKLGTISQKSKMNGLNALNCYRYVAGLSEVVWDSSIEPGMQSASLVSALNGSINHHPTKPLTLDIITYNAGYNYCSQSNLSKNYNNFAGALEGCVRDERPSNISRVGHRRWCLNPSMGKTCFGFVYDNDDVSYTAMYAFDHSNTNDADIINVAWPAQNTPVEFFKNDVPWSLSTGLNLNPLAVRVQLTRVSDGKKWTFSSLSSNGYFNVDNGNYGMVGCVIFRPDNFTVKSGDSYNVRVETGQGTVEYSVNFFAANPPGKENPIDNDYQPEQTNNNEEQKNFDFSTILTLAIQFLNYAVQLFSMLLPLLGI